MLRSHRVNQIFGLFTCLSGPLSCTTMRLEAMSNELANRPSPAHNEGRGESVSVARM
jgi:hypothetical protein